MRLNPDLHINASVLANRCLSCGFFGMGGFMKISLIIGGAFLALQLSGCAEALQGSPQDLGVVVSGEQASSSSESSNLPNEPTNPSPYRNQVALKNAIEVYSLHGNVLKLKVTFPVNGIIEYTPGENPENYDYVDSSGNTRRSSTGFSKIALVNVSQEDLPKFPLARIQELNNTARGLFVFASKLQEEIGRDVIQPLEPARPGSDFYEYFEASGKPKFSFSEKFKERFGAQLNKAVSRASQNQYDQAKWEAIYRELVLAADRTQVVSGQMMFVSQKFAKEASILFENNGSIQKIGAWSIAVTGTARRHGFENVPCAEFVSEVIRQAYTRAGYKVTADFNAERKNPLHWNNTAAVVNLATALYKAGWIPWESASYRPPSGAPMMHFLARSPGHAYLAAGDDGRFIVDNGSPRGRDLRKTTKKIIGMMYMHGVFFLPPGFVPQKW